MFESLALVILVRSEFSNSGIVLLALCVSFGVIIPIFATAPRPLFTMTIHVMLIILSVGTSTGPGAFFLRSLPFFIVGASIVKSHGFSEKHCYGDGVFHILF